MLDSKYAIIHTSIYTLFTIIAYIFSITGSSIVSKIPNALTSECSSDCFDYCAVYKQVITLSVYHLLLMLVPIKGYWILQVLLLAGLFVGPFFISPVFFTSFWIEGFSFSSLFLLVQLLILIDYACNLSTYWLGKYEENPDSVYKYLLISTVVLCYAGTIAITVVLYVYYGNCQLNNAVISVNLVLVLVLSALSILPRIQEYNPKFGLLQAAIISLYVTFLVSGAVSSDICSSSTTDTSTMNLFVKYGSLVIMFGSLGYSAYSTGTIKVSNNETADRIFFHFVFIMASAYMGTVLTEWNVLNQVDGIYTVDRHDAYFWTKIASSWVCVLLYIWVLVAPSLFPNRDFGVE